MRLRIERTPIVVPGCRFAGVSCGLKPHAARDLALIFAPGASGAGVFTTNRLAAAPVQVARRHVRAGRVEAVVANSGVANACTGERGLRVAREMCREVGRRLGIGAEGVIPCSTGRIGVLPPLARLRRGIERACGALAPHGFWAAAEAIRTTDAFTKVAVRSVYLGAVRVTVAGMAKGAGMIAPDMATLLAFVCTDAAATPRTLARILRTAVPETLGSITVDGDTSTNDTVLLIASGRTAAPRVAAAGAHFDTLAAGVRAVLGELGRLVVADGEGASKVIVVDVEGAAGNGDARRIASVVARSMLVKAAVHGGDPNWGRILCAAGYSGVRLDPGRMELSIGGVRVVSRGMGMGPAAEKRAAQAMAGREVRVLLRLHMGSGRARFLTSDLSPAYVRFNAKGTT